MLRGEMSKEALMRTTMLALLIAAAAAMSASGPTQAQESFFNKRYCSVPGGANSGSVLDCSYNTLDQCRGSIGASTRYCSENPNWRPESPAERNRPRR
jgi:hypothetical protein